MICVGYLAQMITFVVAAQYGAPIGEDDTSGQPPPHDGAPVGDRVRWLVTMKDIQDLYAELPALEDTLMGYVGLEYADGNEAAAAQAVSVASAQYPELWFIAVSQSLALQHDGYTTAIDDWCPGASAYVGGIASFPGQNDISGPNVCWRSGSLTDLVLAEAQTVRGLLPGLLP
jgi:hypothetical protein